MPQNQPKLAPPGAGLPWLELQIARLKFRRSYQLSSWEKTDAWLLMETGLIQQLAGPLPVEIGSRQMLIRRLRGLEDSSRNWSVFMTLEHLAIVNESVAGFITALTSGLVPPREASTASVKPSLQADSSTLARFRSATEAVRNAARNVTDLETRLDHAHPWFGPLDAAGWHFMAAFHQQLHRRQIERILQAIS